MYFPICNSLSFDDIENLSWGSLPLVKRRRFPRPITIRVQIPNPRLGVRLMRCLSEPHHSKQTLLYYDHHRILPI